MKYRLNSESFEKALEYLVRRAEGWQAIGSGECQLYGRYDEDGVIYKLFVRDFAGHNSWIEGKGIVMLASKDWFSWQENKDLREWLHNELEGDPELMGRFKKWLKENEYEYDRFDYMMPELFERFDQEKHDAFMNEWRELWLDEYIPDYVYGVIEKLESDYDEWHISEDVPPATLEWDNE